MKNRLLPLLIGGALLPFGDLSAQETYGDFTPGQTFTFTVTEKTVRKTRGTSVRRDVPVPNSIPDFAVGQNVQFTIGGRGQLKGPGFSIAFEGEEGRFNFYSNDPSFDEPNGEAATVRKSSRNRPKSATLTFYKFKFDGFVPVTTVVHYILD